MPRAKPADTVVMDRKRLAVVLSDNIAGRCGCKPLRPAHLQRNIDVVKPDPASKRWTIEWTVYIECRCGATWIWGER